MAPHSSRGASTRSPNRRLCLALMALSGIGGVGLALGHQDGLRGLSDATENNDSVVELVAPGPVAGIRDENGDVLSDVGEHNIIPKGDIEISPNQASPEASKSLAVSTANKSTQVVSEEISCETGKTILSTATGVVAGIAGIAATGGAATPAVIAGLATIGNGLTNVMSCDSGHNMKVDYDKIQGMIKSMATSIAREQILIDNCEKVMHNSIDLAADLSDVKDPLKVDSADLKDFIDETENLVRDAKFVPERCANVMAATVVEMAELVTFYMLKTSNTHSCDQQATRYVREVKEAIEEVDKTHKEMKPSGITCRCRDEKYIIAPATQYSEAKEATKAVGYCYIFLQRLGFDIGSFELKPTSCSQVNYNLNGYYNVPRIIKDLNKRYMDPFNVWWNDLAGLYDQMKELSKKVTKTDLMKLCGKAPEEMDGHNHEGSSRFVRGLSGDELDNKVLSKGLQLEEEEGTVERKLELVQSPKRNKTHFDKDHPVAKTFDGYLSMENTGLNSIDLLKFKENLHDSEELKELPGKVTRSLRHGVNIIRALDSDAKGNVYTLVINGGRHQMWEFIPNTDMGWTRYVIRNVGTGRVLDSNSRGDVYTLPANGGNNQYWAMSTLHPGRLLNVGTGRALDGNSKGKVYAHDYNGGAYQLWLLL